MRQDGGEISGPFPLGPFVSPLSLFGGFGGFDSLRDCLVDREAQKYCLPRQFPLSDVGGWGFLSWTDDREGDHERRPAATKRKEEGGGGFNC